MKKLITLLIILAILPSVLAVYGGGDVTSSSSSSSGGGGGSSGTADPVVASAPVCAGVTCEGICCSVGEQCYLGGCMTTSLIAMLEADLYSEPAPEPVVESVVEPEPEATGLAAITGMAVETLEESPVSVAVIWSAAILVLAVLAYFYFEYKK